LVETVLVKRSNQSRAPTRAARSQRFAAPTEPQRIRRRAARKRRRIRDREAIARCGDIGGFNRDIGMSQGFSPGYSGAVGDEAVPNANYEPSLPSLVRRGGVSPQLLASLGNTVAGQMWALKAAHPNGEEVTASAGIPDHTNVPVVTPEFRCNYTIVGDSTGTGNDDVDILFLPMGQLAFMYRRRTASSTIVDLRTGWKFVFYPSLTAGVDQVGGLVTIGGENVTMNAWTTNLDDYGRSREMYGGGTVHLDAPTLADQGRLVAGQLPVELKEGISANTYIIDDTGTSQGIRSPMSLFQLPGNFPMDESTLFQATPGAVVWEAREGVYLPLRFREPVHLFQPDRADTFLAAPGSTGGVPVTFTDVDKNQIAVGVPTNMLAGVVIIRGIDKRANLNVKCRIGLESLVEAPTEVAPFQHASPILDPLAIDRVTQLSQASPMAYPANYNDFSSILNVIKGVLGNIVKPIAGGLRGIGIPVVSDIAGLIHGGLEGLGMSSRKRRRRALLNSMGRF